MTTYAHEDLQKILALHKDWLYGRARGSRADLTGAVLTGADLTDAVLTGADLTGADLTDAVLTGADLTRAVLTRAVLSDGVTFGEYLSDVVPALLTAGGKALAEVATDEVWACHSWSNCPMHAAFGAEGLRDVPALHRWQAGRFVQFYDAGLIPKPTVEPTEPATTAA